MKVPSPKKPLKKRWKSLFFLIYLSLISLFLFEIAYRFQWYDFYGDELRSLNPPAAIQNEAHKPTILVMGDSFTALPGGYVDQLREELPGYSLINAAVPGTGIEQTALMAPGRIEKFKPAVFIYQIYVGNDLMDISHPLNGEISFLRKAYWFISDRIRSLSFLNFRFAGVRHRLYDDANTVSAPKEEDIFDPQRYAGRQKLYFKAEPQLIENSAFLDKGRAQDFDILVKKLDQIIQALPQECRIILPIIPHCAQVNQQYTDRMLQIGMESEAPYFLLTVEYLFVERLVESMSKGERKVEVWNLLPPLKAADNLTPVYYDNDPHLNLWGQTTIQQTILKALQE